MIDHNFWKTVKSHIWLDNTQLFLLNHDDMFAIVFISSDDIILDTYTTFDNKIASKTYNTWKNKLMKNHSEWFEEI